ncbi:AMP-binding protein [Bradyrhizobium liaoningense]
MRDIASDLAALGVRAGDRMMVTSENCIALAGLLIAAIRLDAAAIVVNPQLSAREIDQIREHSVARRMFFSAAFSREASAHASCLGAEIRKTVRFEQVGISGLNLGAVADPGEDDPARQIVVLIGTRQDVYRAVDSRALSVSRSSS